LSHALLDNELTDVVKYSTVGHVTPARGALSTFAAVDGPRPILVSLIEGVPRFIGLDRGTGTVNETVAAGQLDVRVHLHSAKSIN
jgi:hypothetical protein